VGTRVLRRLCMERHGSANNKWHMLQDDGVGALPVLTIATHVTYGYGSTPMFWGCFLSVIRVHIYIFMCFNSAAIKDMLL